VEIFAERGQYLVRDLGSKNGTFLNGERVGGERKQLKSGDRLELGRGQVVLKFQEPGATLTLMGVSDLIVDSKAREVWFQGNMLTLTPKEYSLLEYLYLHRGEACSKDSLALAGWPEQNGQVGDQDIEQIIRRLRRRIEPNPSKPQYIITMKGYGYKLSLK
jgi:DNA-binding response OmpR family regulator